MKRRELFPLAAGIVAGTALAPRLAGAADKKIPGRWSPMPRPTSGPSPGAASRRPAELPKYNYEF